MISASTEIFSSGVRTPPHPKFGPVEVWWGFLPRPPAWSKSRLVGSCQTVVDDGRNKPFFLPLMLFMV